MRYNVKLKYFEDDDTGIKGFAHMNTYNTYDGFDPFWDVSGIFHDCMEHYFEGTGLFTGDNMCNILGEMVATAHKLYLYYELGIDSFRYRRDMNDKRDWSIDTRYLMQEMMFDDYRKYSYHDIGIPKQRRIDNSYLENAIQEYVDQIEEWNNDAIIKVDSSLIPNAYRYGYKMAQKKWKFESYNLLNDFLIRWNNICKDDINTLSIDDEFAYGINYINFNIDTCKLTCTERVFDNVGNNYHIDKLISY